MGNRTRRVLAAAAFLVCLPALAYANPVAAPAWFLPLQVLLLALMALAGVATEVGIAYLFKVRGKGLGVVALMNLVSIPVANALLIVALTVGLAIDGEFAATTAAVEVFAVEALVILVESVVLGSQFDRVAWPFRKRLVLSLAANVASLLVGFAFVKVVAVL